MAYSWHDFIGNIGVICILLAYLLLQLQRLDPQDTRYLTLNAGGAILILISLTVEFNLSAFLIESCWLLISVLGLIRSFQIRKTKPDGD